MVVICNGAKDVNVVKHQSNGCVQEFSLFCQCVVICRWTMDVNVNTLLREPEILARVFLLC